MEPINLKNSTNISPIHLIFLLIFLLLVENSHCQFIKYPTYKIETGASVSIGQQTPFWLISNQYGLITPYKTNTWLNTGFHSQLDSGKLIDYSYGFNLINLFSEKYDLYLHQAYFSLKIWIANIQLGKIEEKFGNQDSDLSSGGLLWSGNARPMPKITLYTPNYFAIPFTKRFIECKGGISHGWFENNEFMKHAWLHHKYIYFQIGGKLPVHAHYGFHHFAQWGGESTDPEIGKLPSSFSDYIKIFFAKSGEGSIPSSLNEGSNKIGNHIGSRNYGFDIQFKTFNLSTYWQTIFEDGSGKAGRNIADGLWGLSLKFKKSLFIQNICFEFLNTTDQSGTSHLATANSRGGGNDDYFNNWIYFNGWTYYKMVIGNPLITSPLLLSQDTLDYIINNKVKAFHLGIQGRYKVINYKILYTYSQNFGTNYYSMIPKKYQHSLLFRSCFNEILPWKLSVNFDIGLDIGKMYKNNGGIRLSFIKEI